MLLVRFSRMKMEIRVECTRHTMYLLFNYTPADIHVLEYVYSVVLFCFEHFKPNLTKCSSRLARCIDGYV